jgi:hypothetical protein
MIGKVEETPMLLQEMVQSCGVKKRKTEKLLKITKKRR